MCLNNIRRMYSNNNNIKSDLENSSDRCRRHILRVVRQLRISAIFLHNISTKGDRQVREFSKITPGGWEDSTQFFFFYSFMGSLGLVARLFTLHLVDIFL